MNGGGTVRIKAPVPPLVFSFELIDDMLDGMNMIKKITPGVPISVYSMIRCGSRLCYYLLVYPKTTERIKTRMHLSEYGRFSGSGFVMKAFLDEHGKEVEAATVH